MPINEFKGDAPIISEVITITVLEAIAGTLYQPFGSLRISYTAIETDTPVSIATQLATRLTASGLWNVSRSGSVLTLTGRGSTPSGHALGSSIDAPPPPNSVVERVQAGVLAIAQQTDVTLPSTTTGGTWSLSCNFGSGIETASSLAWNITPSELVTALEGLATPGSGDVAVTYNGSTLKFRITWQGDLAGTAVTVTASGSGLTGNATTERNQVSSAGSATEEVQASYIADDWLGGTSLELWHTTVTNAVTVTAFTAAQIKVAVSTLLGLTANDVTVQLHSTAQGTIVIITLANGAAGREWPLLRFNPHYTVGGGQQAYVLSQVIQSALGDERREIQVIADGGTVPSNTSTALYFPFYNDSLLQGWLYAATGTDANQNLALVSGYTAVKDGAALPNEAWTFGSDAQGGTFTISFDGETTSSLAYNASAGTVQTALEALTNITSGDVLVTGAGTLANPWRVEFQGTYEATNVADPTWTTTSLTGSTGKLITISTYRNAETGLNERQVIRVDNSATAGTLKAEFGGYLTTALAYNASASTWDTALEALSSIGSGNVAVSGDPDYLLVEFTGDLAEAPQDLLELHDSTLTITPVKVLNVEVTTYARGPNHWNAPLNWTLGRVPNTSDTVIIADSKVPIQYGLLQRADITIESGANVLSGEHDLIEGQVVRVSLDDYTATLNGGGVTITASTNLYVVSAAPGALQLSTSSTGNPLVWTNGATGTVGVALTQLVHRSQGSLGWPRIRESGTWEIFPQYLAIDLLTAASEEEPNLEINSSAGVLNLDLGATPLRGRVIATGSNPGALRLLINNASAARLWVFDGDVGIALTADESAALKSLVVTGGTVRLGNAQYDDAVVHSPGLIEFQRSSHGASAVETATR